MNEFNSLTATIVKKISYSHFCDDCHVSHVGNSVMSVAISFLNLLDIKCE